MRHALASGLEYAMADRLVKAELEGLPGRYLNGLESDFLARSSNGDKRRGVPQGHSRDDAHAEKRSPAGPGTRCYCSEALCTQTDSDGANNIRDHAPDKEPEARSQVNCKSFWCAGLGIRRLIRSVERLSVLICVLQVFAEFDGCASL